jgi:hypothetical protein
MQSKMAMKLSHRRLRILVGIITGHFFTNHMLYILGLKSDNQCACCRTVDDAQHILLNCGKYFNVRARVMGNFVLSEADLMNCSWKSLLEFAEKSGCFNDHI